VAVWTEDDRCVLVNAAPELTQQINCTPALHPRNGLRDTPIAAVMLTSGELDAITGLLSLRERQPFALHATRRVLDGLAGNAIFDALDPSLVPRHAIRPEEPVTLPGLRLTLFPVPGKPPLYLEDCAEADAEDVVALELTDSAGCRALYVPGCGQVTPPLLDRLDGASAILFDGTVWTDDELSRTGVGTRTGRRMGHQPLSGPDGSLAALRGIRAGRKVLIHLNNTNPLLIEDSPERAEAAAEGWEVAWDGMEIHL
jgi:pyrroloquinoline quinone biosynthesis protein B